MKINNFRGIPKPGEQVYQGIAYFYCTIERYQENVTKIVASTEADRKPLLSRE